MIADEIQSGLARSGRMLACDWEGVCPDVVVRHFSLSLFFEFSQPSIFQKTQILIIINYFGTAERLSDHIIINYLRIIGQEVVPCSLYIFFL